MKRYYFISDDLDDLESVEKELEARGIETPQIHVYSRNDAEVEQHDLHNVEAVLKSDVVHGTERGALYGIIGAAAVLLVAYLTGITETPAGWIPFVFLAIVILGFCTWQGGLFGIQVEHHDFRRFDEELDAGRHVFFVDVADDQKSTLDEVTAKHSGLRSAGSGEATPDLVINAQRQWKSFVNWAP